MSQYQTIQLEPQGRIMILRLARPDAMNALNALMFDELDAYFSKDHQQYSTDCVIITGLGEKAFAAGADIKELHGLKREDAERLSRKGQRIFQSIERFHQPVIAAVNGFALGGGCELAMACHIRIASVKAKFGQPEVNLGIIPGYGGTQRLIQLIGKSKAMELLLTGDMINAETAERLGLVNAVLEPEQVLPAAMAMAEKMLSKGPLALKGVIAAANAYYEPCIDGFSFEAKTFGDVAETEDFLEGTGAFIEKRKADFKGR